MRAASPSPPRIVPRRVLIGQLSDSLWNSDVPTTDGTRPAPADGAVRFERLDLLRIELQDSAAAPVLDEEDEEDEQEDCIDANESEDELGLLESECGSDCNVKRRKTASSQVQSSESDEETYSRSKPPESTHLFNSLFGVSSANETERQRAHSPTNSEGESIDLEGLPDTSHSTRDDDVFVVRGVDCVGCALGPSRLRELDEFVYEYATVMQPDALWLSTAKRYVDRIVKPCARNGIGAPTWSADSIRVHYEHHQLNTRLTRIAFCRQLRGVRTMLVNRLVRVNENEEREPDTKATDQLLKLVQAESREHGLLSATESAPRRGNLTRGKHTAGSAKAADDPS